MRPVIAILFFTFLYLEPKAQSFEGTLTYRVEYEFTNKIDNSIKAKIFSKLKQQGTYYDTIFVTIKGGDYIKSDNAQNGKTVIYKSDLKKLFFFEKHSDTVLVASGQIYNPLNISLPLPSVQKNDSLINIGDFKCKSIQLIWEDMGEEVYYYSPNTSEVNPSLFEEHNYEYLNIILRETKAYPIKVTKALSGLMTLHMTLVSINKEPVSIEKFKIPELKNASRKASETLELTTGYKMMIIQ